MNSPKESILAAEPRGFSRRTRGLSSEYAHEQGWGIDVEERTRNPKTEKDTFRASDNDDGARDFGDVPDPNSPEKNQDAANQPLQPAGKKV